MKDPHQIILKPYITEKSVAMSYGDQRVQDEQKIVRKYTFEVATDANKMQIKDAIEAIYNAGRKESEAIKVTNVHTIKVLGKRPQVAKRRRLGKGEGYRPDRKKAIVTLGAGQVLEDYGV